MPGISACRRAIGIVTINSIAAISAVPPVVSIDNRLPKAWRPFFVGSVLAVLEGNRSNGGLRRLREATLGEWEVVGDHVISGSRRLSITMLRRAFQRSATATPSCR